MKKIILGTIGSLAVASSLFATTKVDVLFLYSPGVENMYGNQVETKIQSLVNTTNKIYKDSGLDLEIVPVKIMKYNVSDKIKSSTAVVNLRKDRNIRKIRDQVGADEVVLYRPYAHDGYCGIGYQLNYLGSASRAKYVKDYTYTNVTINCGSYVTAHEIGHNMGLGHSHVQNSNGAFNYAMGHGQNSDFVTVMAYRSAYSYAKKEYKFSSPKLKCGKNQDNCGIENYADAVRALKITTPRLSSFREHVLTEAEKRVIEEQKRKEQEAREAEEKRKAEEAKKKEEESKKVSKVDEIEKQKEYINSLYKRVNELTKEKRRLYREYHKVRRAGYLIYRGEYKNLYKKLKNRRKVILAIRKWYRQYLKEHGYWDIRNEYKKVGKERYNLIRKVIPEAKRKLRELEAKNK